MSLQRHIVTLLIGASAVLAVGCGSDDSTSGSKSSDTTTTTAKVADTTNTSAKASGTTTTAQSGETTTTATTGTGGTAPSQKPCEALSASEFGAVMGAPSTATTVNDGQPACEYKIAGGGTAVRLVVLTGMSADTATSGLNPSEFQPVTGIGEQLFVSSQGRQAVMKAGGVAYQLTRWEGTVTSAQLTELMRSIIAE